MREPAHSMPLEEMLERLKTDTEKGLTQQRVQKRREKFGYNEFREQEERTILHTFLEQFKNPLVLILLAAGVATVVLGEYIDAIVIAAALVINVSIGVFQEARASKAFEKLKTSQEKHANVIRDGERHVIPARELVPGDLVYIEAGSSVPADMRLVTAKNLSTNESALTGEWIDISKATGVSDEEAPITDQQNMVWMGTLVTNGFGRGVVTAIGDNTEVGEIAASLGDIEDEKTPLQQSIQRIAQFLLYAVAAALVVIFVLGITRGEALTEMLLIAIAVAVAAIPQGLPAAVTVVLALGMESILQRGGLVRNLLAAETLGATTIILTDKTGTLTQAKMRLKRVISISTLGERADAESTAAQREYTTALMSGVAAASAFLEEDDDGEQEVHGSPIETAVLRQAKRDGITREDVFAEQEQLDFQPFDNDAGVAASLHHRIGKKNRVYVTGVPEDLIEWANTVHCEAHAQTLRDEERQAFREAQTAASEKGYRLIGVGYVETSRKTLSDLSKEELSEALREEGITLIGLFVFEDPVREDVSEAIDTVHSAGADVIMLTGDNAATAKTIAVEAGVACQDTQVLTGSEIDELDDAALLHRLRQTQVIARVLPKQKLRIARLLKRHGEVVAMTGDGVNDAPALRSANIGVAVGSGTEVAKEASDLILIDDSFSIIVAAIEEGRKIIDNLKKIVAYLISTSFSEIVLIGGALAVGSPLPILPTQILWANIVEEGLMSFSYAFERPAPGIMQRDPRSAESRNVLTRELRVMIGILVVSTGAFLLGLYAVLMHLGLPLDEVRTLMFVAVSIDSIFFTFSLKSLRQPLWRIPFMTNPYLLIAAVASILLLVAAVTVPFFQTLLSTVPLTPQQWGYIAAVGLANLVMIEVAKYIAFVRKTPTDSE